MARPLRIEFPGAIYHLISRGNARSLIFEDKFDRKIFLSLIEKVVEQFNWLFHGYCLMDNHYHLLVETIDGNLSHAMRHLNGVYTQRFNRRHNRVGHVFQGRYKAILVQREHYLLELCRYIVLNPVRIGLVKNPEEYVWSSYQATSGLGEPPPFLTVDWILSQFSDIRQEAEKLYREFVHQGINSPDKWKGLKTQTILGDQDFIAKIKPALKDRSALKEVPKREFLVFRPSLEHLLNEKIQKERIKRDQAILSAHLHYSYSLVEIGSYLGLHYTTISKIIKHASAPN
ncbi:MAG: transposase [Deltaproteobacteria bacterium]|nr:transposase [Deltaproteobacteria bacterium]